MGQRLSLEARRERPRALVRRLELSCSPLQLFSALQREGKAAFLFEASGGYSFLGFRPSGLVRVRRGLLELERADGISTLPCYDPLPRLRELMGTRRARGPFAYMGGAVGYFSYDVVRYWEQLPSLAQDDLFFPELELGLYEDGVAFDPRGGRAYYFSSGEDRSAQLAEHARGAQIGGLEHGELRCNLSRGEYEALVAKAKRYIAAGEVFQLVLSRRYEARIEGDLLAFYRVLRRINPSPYMYFLKFEDRFLVGSSPEMLVRVRGRRVETYPIAGTRPRTSDVGENRRLREELLADPKERAEHLMLVDLARNDCGRVCRYGTVRVPELFAIRQFSHVQHITSLVTGELRPGLDPLDALRALFPAGTVSGAPKVRAMELIEELEPVRRGPYAGAVGYLSFTGDADFAITIRTLVAKGGRALLQAGAGIVADSVPEREWLETEHKLKALQQALREAEGT
ncbi:MAG: anthranilate synthase component I [Nitrososphaerota archaeon]